MKEGFYFVEKGELSLTKSGALSKMSGADWVRILRRAALAGRRGVQNNYDLESRTRVLSRGAGGDLTLQIDKASESRIFRSLQGDLGKDSFVFISEEIGEVKSEGEEPRPIVVCDPLDGSHNAEVGVPLYSISLSVLGLTRRIGLDDKRYLRDVDIGFVLNIPTGDEYYAIKSAGAFHDRRRISKKTAFSNPKKITFTTIGVECGDVDLLKRAIRNLTSQNTLKLRVLGSAAISLCLLADASIDALLFIQPKGARTIDCPAGYLIATESGRVFSVVENKLKSLAAVELGFDSRVNVLGARDSGTLSSLSKLIRL